MIRVLIADDEPLVGELLRAILAADDQIEVVGVAYDGLEAVELTTRLHPDLVLMDLRMPRVDGVEATRRISAGPEAPPVLALTTFDADDYVLGALHAGAAGYLLKSTPPEELPGLVQVAAAGHTVMSRTVADKLLRPGEQASPAAQRLAELTAREQEVLGLVSTGRSNAQIARELHLSETTVKGYVSRVLDKLGCANRTQAGLIGYRYLPHGARSSRDRGTS